MRRHLAFALLAPLAEGWGASQASTSLHPGAADAVSAALGRQHAARWASSLAAQSPASTSQQSDVSDALAGQLAEALSSSRGQQRPKTNKPVLGGRQVTTTAPWPFIDPQRPTVLPEYVSASNTRASKPPVALVEALLKVKDNATARVQGTERDLLSGRPRNRTVFNETVELIANLKVNTRKADQIVRGAVQLPHGTGKTVTICVFAKGEDAEAAKQAGADVIGDEELIQTIIESGGKALGFDKLIATPDFMKPLAKAGKVLGPKGLMPNAKLGTLTSDVVTALKDMRRGRLDFRVDRNAIVHAALGKVSFTPQQLADNVGAFAAALLELRPASLPGAGMEGYIKSIFIKSSMTPSMPVTLDSVDALAQAVLAAKAKADAEAAAAAEAKRAATQH